jgi:putative alpha-1,2-mannosidase
MYHTLISPQNYTGENPLWETDGPSFDSFYCLWDLFRYSHPLYNVLVPEAQAQMVESLIDIYRHEGWLPDCRSVLALCITDSRMSFCKGFTQGGSNADNVLTDAFIKGINPVSWSDGFQAIQKVLRLRTWHWFIIQDAEVEAPDPGNEGRMNIFEYDHFGYVPADSNYSGVFNPTTASRSLEYTYNDFSIAMFARQAGNRSVYDKFINRTSNWKNLWSPDAVEPRTGVSGFFQGRLSNGSWVTNPIGDHCTSCFIGLPGNVDHQFFEESAWTYSWFVPHDNAQLIELVGGKEAFIEKLGYSGASAFSNIQISTLTNNFQISEMNRVCCRLLYIITRYDLEVGLVNDGCREGLTSLCHEHRHSSVLYLTLMIMDSREMTIQVLPLVSFNLIGRNDGGVYDMDYDRIVPNSGTIGLSHPQTCLSNSSMDCHQF